MGLLALAGQAAAAGASLPSNPRSTSKARPSRARHPTLALPPDWLDCTQLLAAAGMDKGALEEQLAQREEEALVAEFKRALEYNIGQVRGLAREWPAVAGPRGGWLVTAACSASALRGRRALCACAHHLNPSTASQTGTTLSRSSRKKHAPQRPAAGWGLLVQPLGKAARAAAAQPFVALPDGSKRELTADEKLQLERQQPRPRHKIL